MKRIALLISLCGLYVAIVVVMTPPVDNRTKIVKKNQAVGPVTLPEDDITRAV